MNRKKKIIVANWKMAPSTIKEAKTMFSEIKKVASRLRNVETVVCSPFVYLTELKKLVGGHRCVLGAQDSFENEEVAHTGEISPSMLKNVGAKYVISGHSERRAMYETDEIVNKKVKFCLKNKLSVILCIGEKHRDANGDFTKFISGQLEQSLAGINKNMIKNLVVAYEPIWAVGKDAKESDSPEDFLEISILIRKTIAGLFSTELAMSTPVLYGGSVNPNNAEGFLSVGKADGLLVGRASLDTKKFSQILKIANSVK